jgi:anaphase-promoting complex subunit 10
MSGVGAPADGAAGLLPPELGGIFDIDPLFLDAQPGDGIDDDDDDDRELDEDVDDDEEDDDEVVEHSRRGDTRNSKNAAAKDSDDSVQDHQDWVEVGAQAVWSVSSAKPGYGVDKLRDGSVETYWQSDGIQPHIVSIQFNRRVAVTAIAFYCDEQLDESYTPVTVSVRSGTSFHDLEEVRRCDVSSPNGYVRIALTSPPPAGDADMLPLRTNLLQFAVLANFDNGRDCHIRQIKVFGLRQSLSAALRLPEFERATNARWALIR